MSTEQTRDNKNRYYTVIDGSFRVQVPQSHPEAVERQWETKDGKSGIKYEKHVQAVFGVVEGITITDGDFGKSLNIYLDPNEDGETPVISLSVDSRYGEDVLKKLPNLSQEKEYRFMPYAFVPEGKEKEVRGVSIASKDEDEKFTVKVENFFWDGAKNTNGYPEPTEEDKEDWAFFYKKANKFLVKYAQENVLPKFEKEQNKSDFDYPEDPIDPKSIPF